MDSNRAEWMFLHVEEFQICISKQLWFDSAYNDIAVKEK